jgi:hypothetical protein
MFCAIEVLHATILLANSVVCFPDYTSSGEFIYSRDFYLFSYRINVFKSGILNT